MTSDKTLESGFTLIETMVSLVLIAMLTTAGSAMLITTLNGSRQVSLRSDAILEMQTAHAVIRDDIVQIVERPTAAAEGLDPPVIMEGTSGDNDRFLLRFTRSGWQNPGGLEARGDLQRVEYLLEEGTLFRRAWARPDAVRSTPVYDVPLVAGLSAVSVRYRIGSEWVDEWYAAEGSARGLPDVVEMTFVFAEQDSLIARFMTGGGA